MPISKKNQKPAKKKTHEQVKKDLEKKNPELVEELGNVNSSLSSIGDKLVKAGIVNEDEAKNTLLYEKAFENYLNHLQRYRKNIKDLLPSFPKNRYFKNIKVILWKLYGYDSDVSSFCCCFCGERGLTVGNFLKKYETKNAKFITFLKSVLLRISAKDKNFIMDFNINVAISDKINENKIFRSIFPTFQEHILFKVNVNSKIPYICEKCSGDYSRIMKEFFEKKLSFNLDETENLRPIKPNPKDFGLDYKFKCTEELEIEFKIKERNQKAEKKNEEKVDGFIKKLENDEKKRSDIPVKTEKIIQHRIQ